MTSIISKFQRWLKPQDQSENKLDLERLPQHVAIIMDGNGRWAKKRGLPRLAGHRAGVQAIREVVEIAPKLGIKFITLYTFSVENWQRPKTEVLGLMSLFREMVEAELDNLHENNVRIRAIGDLEGIETATKETFERALKKTRNNSGLNLMIALNYSGREDILRAARKLAEEQKVKAVDLENVTQEQFAMNLETAEIPDPELIIRTSGELRLSNFLIWESAYSEFWVTKKLWPDFRKDDFIQALYEYQNRNRRFGGLDI